MTINYSAARKALLNQATRYAGTEYAKTLRHVALDCDYAAEGCEASAQSVAETLAADHELALEVESRACVQSTAFMTGVAA